jgi:hypothetical protein
MPKRNWTAKWIWIDGDAQPRNMHVVVRKTFRLADPAVKAELAISADSRYRLMINGQWIGDGPARSFPHRQQFDLYDIAPYLHIGDNTVAISAVHYGEGTFHYILGRAAVLCQIDIENRRGEKLIISSDRTWKILPLSAYSTAVPASAARCRSRNNTTPTLSAGSMAAWIRRQTMAGCRGNRPCRHSTLDRAVSANHSVSEPYPPIPDRRSRHTKGQTRRSGRNGQHQIDAAPG